MPTVDSWPALDWQFTIRRTSDGILLAQIELPSDLLDSAPPSPLQHDWLTASETGQLLRFRQTADQWRMLAGRILLRTCLRDHFGIAFAQFDFGEHNKPILSAQPGTCTIDFNLTHDRRFLLAAFSTSHEVGIDIAARADFADWQEFAGGYLAPSEIAWVAEAKYQDQPWRALRLWTLKEAMLKSTGHGLDIDPREIILMPDCPNQFAQLPASFPPAEAFTLREWHCNSDTGVALASVMIPAQVRR